MTVHWLLKRTKRVYSRGGMTLHYELPNFGFVLEATEAAEATAQTLKAIIQRNIDQGKDIQGQHRAIGGTTGQVPTTRKIGPRSGTDSRINTAKRRQYDVSAPQRMHQQVRLTKKGKVSQKKRGPRWATRYPQGKGSKAGSTFALDSGYLRDNITVEVSGNSARVLVPKERAAAVNAMEAMGFSILGFPRGFLENAAQGQIDAIMASMPQGTRKLSATKLILAAILKGALGG